MSNFDEMDDASCSAWIHVKKEPELLVDVVEEHSPACYYCALTFKSVSMVRKHIKLRHMDHYLNADGSHFEFVAVGGDSKPNGLLQQHAGGLQNEAVDPLAESNSVVGDNPVLIKIEPVDPEDGSEISNKSGVGDNLALIKEEPVDIEYKLELSQNSGVGDNQVRFKEEPVDIEINLELAQNFGGNSDEEVGKSFRQPGRQKSMLSKRGRCFCPFCEYSVSCVTHLKSHINLQHMKEKPHLCRYCEYRTAWESGLKRHERLRHTNRKQYSCTFCEFKSVRRKFLTAHIKDKHTQKTPRVCSHCKVTSKLGSASNSHTVKKPCACECGSIKAEYASSEKHTKPEDRETFNCSFCDFRSTQRVSLKMHIFYRHTVKTHQPVSIPTEYSNMKTYVTPKQTNRKLHFCNYCDFKTAQSDILQTHMTSRHTGGKPIPPSRSEPKHTGGKPIPPSRSEPRHTGGKPVPPSPSEPRHTGGKPIPPSPSEPRHTGGKPIPPSRSEPRHTGGKPVPPSPSEPRHTGGKPIPPSPSEPRHTGGKPIPPSRSEPRHTGGKPIPPSRSEPRHTGGKPIPPSRSEPRLTGGKSIPPSRSEPSSAEVGGLHAWAKMKLSKKRRYWCKYCEFSSSKGDALGNHVTTHHKSETPRSYPDPRSAQCDNPKTTVTTKRAKNKRYSCRYCEFSSSKCEPLKVHIMGAHYNDEETENGNSESCDATEQETDKKHSWSNCESLGTHFLAQDPNEEPDPSIHLVLIRAESRTSKTYVIAKQTNDKKFPCSECVGVSQCECLETRLMDQDANEDPVFTRTQSRHTAAIKADEKLHPCVYCEFSTTHGASLKTHVIACHSDETPYSSTQAGALKTYVTPNRSTKRYFCAQCEFKTAQSAVLQAHIVAKHSNDKP